MSAREDGFTGSAAAADRKRRQKALLLMGAMVVAGSLAALLLLPPGDRPLGIGRGGGAGLDPGSDPAAGPVPSDAGTDRDANDEDAREVVLIPVPVEPASATPFDPLAIYGRVIDEVTRSPVSGATLKLRAAELAGTSDDDGVFRLLDVGLLASSRLAVTADGFEGKEFTLLSGRFEEVALRPLRRVSGRVLHASSRQPAPAVTVSSRARSWNGDGWNRFTSCTTNAEGGWGLSVPLREERLDLYVEAPGHLAQRMRVQLVAGRDEGYDLLLEEVSEVIFEAFNATTGGPVPDLPLSIDDREIGTTDGRGMLTLMVGIERSLSMWIEVPGWCTTHIRPRLAEARQGGATVRVPIPMLLGGTVTGTVRDAMGAPVAGVRVRANGRNGGSVSEQSGALRNRPGILLANVDRNTKFSDGSGTVRSQDDGTYTITGLFPGGRTMKASVDAHMDSRGVLVDLPSPGSSATADLTIQQGCAIEGTVRIAGNPETALVVWNHAMENRDGEFRTNDAGAFRLEGLPPGEIQLFPCAPPANQDWHAEVTERDGVWTLIATGQTGTPVQLVDGETTRVDLELDSAAITIGGLVQNKDGAPVEGAIVQSWPEAPSGSLNAVGNYSGWSESMTRTDGDGRFILFVQEPTAPGHMIKVSSDAGAVIVNNVQANTSDLVIVLDRSGQIRLVVKDAIDDSSITGYTTLRFDETAQRFRGASGVTRHYSPDAGGGLILELPWGRLDLIVDARNKGYTPRFVPDIDVRDALVSGDAPTVEVFMERGARLALTFIGPDGEPARPPGKRMRLVADDQKSPLASEDRYASWAVSRCQQVRPGRRSGKVTLAGLPPGKYAIERAEKGVTLEPRRIEILPGVDQEVTILWSQDAPRSSDSDKPRKKKTGQ